LSNNLSLVAEKDKNGQINNLNENFVLSAIIWNYKDFLNKFTIFNEESEREEDSVFYHFIRTFSTYGFRLIKRYQHRWTEPYEKVYKSFILDGKDVNKKENQNLDNKHKLCLLHEFVDKWINNKEFMKNDYLEILIKGRFGIMVFIKIFYNAYLKILCQLLISQKKINRVSYEKRS